jgi:hypothetical protein
VPGAMSPSCSPATCSDLQLLLPRPPARPARPPARPQQALTRMTESCTTCSRMTLLNTS